MYCLHVNRKILQYTKQRFPEQHFVVKQHGLYSSYHYLVFAPICDLYCPSVINKKLAEISQPLQIRVFGICSTKVLVSVRTSLVYFVDNSQTERLDVHSNIFFFIFPYPEL